MCVAHFLERPMTNIFQIISSGAHLVSKEYAAIVFTRTLFLYSFLYFKPEMSP